VLEKLTSVSDRKNPEEPALFDKYRVCDDLAIPSKGEERRILARQIPRLPNLKSVFDFVDPIRMCILQESMKLSGFQASLGGTSAESKGKEDQTPAFRGSSTLEEKWYQLDVRTMPNTESSIALLVGYLLPA
jgi:hypothetical protein